MMSPETYSLCSLCLCGESLSAAGEPRLAPTNFDFDDARKIPSAGFSLRALRLCGESTSAAGEHLQTSFMSEPVGATYQVARRTIPRTSHQSRARRLLAPTASLMSKSAETPGTVARALYSDLFCGEVRLASAHALCQFEQCRFMFMPRLLRE